MLYPTKLDPKLATLFPALRGPDIDSRIKTLIEVANSISQILGLYAGT